MIVFEIWCWKAVAGLAGSAVLVTERRVAAHRPQNLPVESRCSIIIHRPCGPVEAVHSHKRPFVHPATQTRTAPEGAGFEASSRKLTRQRYRRPRS